MVTTLGLGGQASIQLPPADLSPVFIIRKALAKGINYIDTSNRYGPNSVCQNLASGIDILPAIAAITGVP